LPAQLDVDHATVARLLAEYGIKPHRFGTFKSDGLTDASRNRDFARSRASEPCRTTTFGAEATGRAKRGVTPIMSPGRW
jgi:hypothetical protein